MSNLIYEEVPAENGKTQIKKTDENGIVFWIPKEPANSDYQEYLKNK